MPVPLPVQAPVIMSALADGQPDSTEDLLLVSALARAAAHNLPACMWMLHSSWLLDALLQGCEDGCYVSADKKVIYRACQNEGLRALLLGEKPADQAGHPACLQLDTLAILGSRTLPVLPMPGDDAAGWMLVMHILYQASMITSLSVVRGRQPLSQAADMSVSAGS